jgi:hypothetical protein
MKEMERTAEAELIDERVKSEARHFNSVIHSSGLPGLNWI